MADGLNEEEQKLFETMKDGKEPDKPEADAAAKEAADKVAKDAADKAAKDAAGKESEKAKGVVPVEALKEARSQNKELRKELDEMKKLVSAGDEKLKRLFDGIQKRAEETAPKYEEDAAGHLKHKTDSLEKENADLKKGIDELNQRLAAGEKAAKDGTDLQRFASSVSAREAAYAKAVPDYYKAAEYVAQVWRDEFTEAGLDEENIPGAVFQKSLAITQQASAKGKDPAEVIYKIAQRYGWKTEAPKEEPKGKKADSKLETIAKGMDAAKKAGGGDGPDDPSFASLATMDDEQIEKLVQDKDWWNKTIRRSALH